MLRVDFPDRNISYGLSPVRVAYACMCVFVCFSLLFVCLLLCLLFFSCVHAVNLRSYRLRQLRDKKLNNELKAALRHCEPRIRELAAEVETVCALMPQMCIYYIYM
jgi:hypothetical protein